MTDTPAHPTAMKDQLHVEYVYPGLMVSESASQPIASETDINPPKHCVGYRTFRRREAVWDGELLKGAPREHSPFTYFGRALTLADVEREIPDKRTLLSNMRGNGYARVVAFANGQSYPLNDGDRVIER